MRLIFCSLAVSASAVSIWFCKVFTRTALGGSTFSHVDDLLVENVVLDIQFIGRAGDPLLDRADTATEHGEIVGRAADQGDRLVHDGPERIWLRLVLPRSLSMV